MGVEIKAAATALGYSDVTPCEGVGVEIEDMSKASSQPFVTPCEGVGVEIIADIAYLGTMASRLARAWE